MWALFSKLTKWLAAFCAVIVIFLAVGLGAFRLLVTQLPSYQGEIQDWARDALGLTVRFSRLDARWALGGPELTFHRASVGERGLSAREASIGFNALKMLTQRQLVVDRLTLQGTRLTVERTAGGLRLQGMPSEGSNQQVDLALEDLPPVRVVVRDSSVVYVDQTRNGALWQFDDVRMTLARDRERIALVARAQAPRALASRVELSAEGILEQDDSPQAGDWRFFVELREVDLAELSQLLAANAGLPEAGVGDLSLWLGWRDGAISQATAELAVRDLVLAERREAAVAGLSYEDVEFTAEWSRTDAGWYLALSNLSLSRDGRAWPDGLRAGLRVGLDGGTLRSLRLQADFLRLEDLGPLVRTLPEHPIGDQWMDLAPQGELEDVEVELARTATDQWDYQLTAGLRDVAVEAVDGLPGLSGLTADLRADERSGRLNIASDELRFEWPEYFRAPLEADVLSGIVLWRRGRSNLRLVSDDLVLNNRDASTRSNLEFTIPLDGGSPRLELESDIFSFDAGSVGRYLPATIMPHGVLEWLDRSIVAGRISDGRVSFVGPIDGFPFDGGDGEFRGSARVEGGVLEFMQDWPDAEGLTGNLEFFNASFRGRGSGRILGHRSSDILVTFEDLREGTIEVTGSSMGSMTDVMAFLKGAPLIARHLGPDLQRLDSSGGDAQVWLDLVLPLKNRPAYALDADLRMLDSELYIEGFGPRATDINGTLTLRDGLVTGEGIEATLLDGPVVAQVLPPNEPGYRARLAFEGEVATDAVAAAFDLPFSHYLAGQARWQGSLLLPANATGPRAPFRVHVGSNLSGVALKFPAPLAKAPGDPTSFGVDFVFSAGRLDVQGNLGAARRFAVRFHNDGDRLAFERAGVRFGGAQPELPDDNGLSIRGPLPEARLDDWLGILGSLSSVAGNQAPLLQAELAISNFSAFGQRLGNSELNVRRAGNEWFVEIASEAIAGELAVPVDLESRGQIMADMSRLYLAAGDETSLQKADPRRLPGLQIQSEAFAIGNRRFGRLDADIQADPLGLRLVSFQTTGESFAVEGSGGWFDGPAGPATRLALTLSSDDLASTLSALGFGPVAEGEEAALTASVYWSGPPSANWSEHINGDVAVRMADGSVLDLEPGAGRVVGLMSITALPRRLALDFRDVFNRGLVFDEVSGDFVIIDGNAYTDNLKLTGPVAEIGVAGRTGLRDQDWQQQAVVTAEPGNMLPTVGAILGGSGVGAALLIFTQIFKEPLKGIGRASYCVTGTWDEPVVEQLTPAELQEGRLCADLPPGGFSMVQP